MVFCARQVGKMMLAAGVAVWSSEFKKLLPGPNIANLIDEIEESKRITGGFHPHVARRIFSTIMQDWKYADYWKIPNCRDNNLWKIRVSILKWGPNIDTLINEI